MNKFINGSVIKSLAVGSLATILVACGTCFAKAEEGPANPQTLVLNGGFEEPVAAPGSIPAWNTVAFGQSPAVLLERNTGQFKKGDASLRVKFAADADNYCSFVFQRLPDKLDANDRAKLSFWYYITSEVKEYPVSIEIASNAGGGVPCVTTALTGIADGQWHLAEFLLDLQGLNPSSVISFGFMGKRRKADVVLFDDLSLTYLAKKELRCDILTPGNYTSYTDDPAPRMLEFIIRAPRFFEGGRFDVTLYPEGKIAETITQMKIGVTYPETQGQFNISNLAPGKYLIRVVGNDKSGKVSVEGGIGFTVIAPASDTVRVRANTLYIGKKRFLPIGLYKVGEGWLNNIVNADSKNIGAPVLSTEEMVRNVVSQGFNFGMVDFPSQGYLNLLKKYRFGGIASANPGQSNWVSEAQMGSLAGDQALMGFYGGDEPMPGPKLQEATELYRMLRKAAPHKVVLTAIYAFVPAYYEAKFADIIMFDDYPIMAADSDLTQQIERGMRTFVEFTRARPWIVPGFCGQAMVLGGKEPTPQQFRAQTYLALVCGARAFSYYAYTDWPTMQQLSNYPTIDSQTRPAEKMSKNPKRNRWFLPDSYIWDGMASLFKELAVLEDAIFAPDVTDNFVTAETKGLEVTLRKVSSSEFIFIAVNPRGKPNKGVFSLQGLPASLSLEPLVNTRPVTLRDNQISLDLKEYEVAVFRIKPTSRIHRWMQLF